MLAADARASVDQLLLRFIRPSQPDQSHASCALEIHVRLAAPWRLIRCAERITFTASPSRCDQPNSWRNAGRAAARAQIKAFRQRGVALPRTPERRRGAVGITHEDMAFGQPRIQLDGPLCGDPPRLDAFHRPGTPARARFATRTARGSAPRLAARRAMPAAETPAARRCRSTARSRFAVSRA